MLNQVFNHTYKSTTMNKILPVITAIALTGLAFTACGQNNNKKTNAEMKTLVAYFSATGTTKAAAQQLAKDLQTNVRYISAVVRVQFHTNYSTFVNRYRVEEAMSILTDQRYSERTIEEVGDMVGFAHRQSFHTAFLKHVGMTPNAYRSQYEVQLSFAKAKK